jgi:hypothetical protein
LQDCCLGRWHMLPQYDTSSCSTRCAEEITTSYRGNGALQGWLLLIKDNGPGHCHQ